MFGPKLGPFLVGCVLGLTSFASIGVAEGYPGASMNPARCFAFAVARSDFQREQNPSCLSSPYPPFAYIYSTDQWIWWFAPLTGSLVQCAVYHAAPPYHRERARDKAASAQSEEVQVKV